MRNLSASGGRRATAGASTRCGRSWGCGRIRQGRSALPAVTHPSHCFGLSVARLSRWFSGGFHPGSATVSAGDPTLLRQWPPSVKAQVRCCFRADFCPAPTHPTLHTGHIERKEGMYVCPGGEIYKRETCAYRDRDSVGLSDLSIYLSTPSPQIVLSPGKTPLINRSISLRQ